MDKGVDVGPNKQEKLVTETDDDSDKEMDQIAYHKRGSSAIPAKNGRGSQCADQCLPEHQVQ
eukprot:13995212-Ditylum_brightwellii.AAC.1